MHAAAADDKPAKVLDTWALMAWLRDEPAAQRIDQLWTQASAGELRLLVSVVNVGEVFYLTARWRSLGDAELVLRHIQEMPLEVRPAPNTLVLEAARLKAVHRLSYADAFAVATSIREGALLVTGDPEMKALEGKGIVRLDWVR